MTSLKSIIKYLLPDRALRFFTGLFYGWSGNFETWAEAKSQSSGYDLPSILEKVKDSTFRVKNGIVPYERDSVIFDKVHYSYPLLSCLMWAAAKNKGKLNILDFGGSLGSTYYQNKCFLDSLDSVKWNIVEQPEFVKIGRESFSDEIIHFYTSIEDCLNENKIDIVLFSSVLQYTESPYALLNEIKTRRIKHILIDRTPFIKGRDRITIQKVHPKIYKASYPCWFFNEAKFIDFFSTDYEMIVEFDSLDVANIVSEFKGFLFILKPIQNSEK